MKGSIILAIESSCDETAVAIMQGMGETSAPRLLASVISSQIPLHREYGGVIPELASRNHSLALPPLVREALHRAEIDITDVDAFAATTGPGLVAALIVGNTTAKALALALNKPFIAINHLEGHLLSPFITDEQGLCPHLGLIVSGGHTLFIDVEGLGQYGLLGRSVDDAAGEAFDKIEKMLELPYPGGPEMDLRAQRGNAKAYALPRPMIHANHGDVSFSGLKTAVLYLLPEILQGKSPHEIPEAIICDLCASAQQAIIDVLIHKLKRALTLSGRRTLALSGGVSCNSALRQQLVEACQLMGIELLLPDYSMTTDNAAMIAYSALLHHEAGHSNPLSTPVDPNYPLFATVSQRVQQKSL